ncbi:hypothetical protein GF312_09735 [Candidatus Poribacteria bacterium]|nr:hypothetical protein [Candidatus Poribacteria bacterium]
MKALYVKVCLIILCSINFSVFASSESWNIKYLYSEPSIVSITLPAGFVFPITINFDVSGVIRVTSPGGKTSFDKISNTGEYISPAYLYMGEKGQYIVEETYKLIVKASYPISDTYNFIRTHRWIYNNSQIGILSFKVNDMYMDNFSSRVESDSIEIITDVSTLPACKIGKSIRLYASTLRLIEKDEIITALIELNACWNKTTSTSSVKDNVYPVIASNPVEAVEAGAFLQAEITDNFRLSITNLMLKKPGDINFTDIKMFSPYDSHIYYGNIPPDTETGVAEYYFQAVDLAGNETIFPDSHYFVNIEPANLKIQKMELNLWAGWNLVSIPLDIEDNSISSVFKSIEASCNSIFTYIPTHGWLQYIFGYPESYNTLEILEAGRGYWIDMNDDAVLLIEGKKSAKTDIMLTKGWNIIGYNSSRDQLVEDAISSIEIGYPKIFTYNAIANQWLMFSYERNYLNNELIEMSPTKGYLIYVSQDCLWYLFP